MFWYLTDLLHLIYFLLNFLIFLPFLFFQMAFRIVLPVSSPCPLVGDIPMGWPKWPKSLMPP